MCNYCRFCKSLYHGAGFMTPPRLVRATATFYKFFGGLRLDANDLYRVNSFP